MYILRDKILRIWIIFALLRQNVVIMCFSEDLVGWRAKSAELFTFRMYGQFVNVVCDITLQCLPFAFGLMTVQKTTSDIPRWNWNWFYQIMLSWTVWSQFEDSSPWSSKDVDIYSVLVQYFTTVTVRVSDGSKVLNVLKYF